MEYVLGIDGGATHTRAVILDASGKEVGTGEADGSNPLVAGFDAAVTQIIEAARAAALEANTGVAIFDAACLGLAGLGREKDRQRVEELVSDQVLATEVEVDHDAAVALYGALGGEPGVITTAGTGALSFGANAQGDRARADGWGRLMGDEGSGYDLAVQSLRATARSLEGRGPETAVLQKVFAATGAGDLDQLATWLYEGYRSSAEIAALAKCALDAAEEGDEVAAALVAQAGSSLGKSAAVVAAQLFAPDSPVAVSYGGTLLKRSRRLQEIFTTAVQERVPNAAVQPPLHSPAFGAALRALQILRDSKG